MKVSPETIKAIRVAYGLTQAEAANLIHCTTRSFQRYESGDRVMHPAFAELLRIKAKKHLAGLRT